MPNKKLAIVTPGYYEQMVGGSEYQSYLLAEAAREAGLDVHHIYIALDSVKQPPNTLGISLHPVRSPWYRKYVRGLGNTACTCIPQTWRLLKMIQPDYVYCRSGVVQAGLAAYYTKHYECKSIWHVAHLEDVTPVPVRRNLRRPLDILERWAVDYAIQHSDIVVCHARYQAEALKQHFSRDSEVILKEQPAPREIIDKSGPFTVIWVANFKGWKQPEMFIRLAKRFDGDDRLKFIMVGRPAGNEYQNKLEASMSGLANLEYRGELPIGEVNEILAKSHIFVNTSINEGLPNTFVQAWMREVPVVSMLWDPDDILRSGKVGFFSGSFEQMVQDVRTLIDNPVIRNEMGVRARAYALENHSLSKNMGRLLELITA